MPKYSSIECFLFHQAASASQHLHQDLHHLQHLHQDCKEREVKGMQSKTMPKNKRTDVGPVKKVTVSNMGTGGAEGMIKQSIPPKRREWNNVFLRLTQVRLFCS